MRNAITLATCILTLSVSYPAALKAQEATPQPTETADPQGKLWSEANDAISQAYYLDTVDSVCPQPGQADPAKVDLQAHLNKYNLPDPVKQGYLWLCSVKLEEAQKTRAAYKNMDPALAEAWQGVFGLVYKALDIMRKGTYASQGAGGEGVDMQTLLPHYTETQGQLRNSLDALYFTKGAHSSLGGRGRAILPQLELVYQQIENIRIAASKRDYKAYADGFDSMCRLCKNIQLTLISQAPPDFKFIAEPFPKKTILSLIRGGARWIMWYCLILFVIIFVFTRMPKIGASDLLEQAWARWSVRIKELSYEYNKQFLGVGAGWLLYGPLIISVMFGLLTMNIFIFLIAAFIFGYLLPTEGLRFVKDRRRVKMETQLLDSLILLSDAMKSGLDLVQGIELAVHELVPPISEEFDLMLKNYKLGMPFDDALKGFESRAGSNLVSYVVRAIIIQRQTGGNMTKIFDRIVETIREESKLQDKVNALTAGPRMQSMVIMVLPWGMLVIVYFFSPEMVGSFFASLFGVITILACVFWQMIGLVVIRKLAKIEV